MMMIRMAAAAMMVVVVMMTAVMRPSIIIARTHKSDLPALTKHQKKIM